MQADVGSAIVAGGIYTWLGTHGLGPPFAHQDKTARPMCLVQYSDRDTTSPSQDVLMHRGEVSRRLDETKLPVSWWNLTINMNYLSRCPIHYDSSDAFRITSISIDPGVLRSAIDRAGAQLDQYLPAMPSSVNGIIASYTQGPLGRLNIMQGDIPIYSVDIASTSTHADDSQLIMMEYAHQYGISVDWFLELPPGISQYMTVMVTCVDICPQLLYMLRHA